MSSTSAFKSRVHLEVPEASRILVFFHINMNLHVDFQIFPKTPTHNNSALPKRNTQFLPQGKDERKNEALIADVTHVT